jgi:hypothetical protein
MLLLFALAGTVLSAWSGMRWPAAWVAAGGFGASALALVALVARPSVEIYESGLKLGRRLIAWREIRRLDRTGWNSPLVVRLTVKLHGGMEKLTLVYPGDLDSCASLLRHLRRYSREALLDGVPYSQFWGEVAAQNRQLPAGKAPAAELPPVRYPVLRPEEEEEIERMFQRLKAEGSLEHGGAKSQHGGPRDAEEK